MICSMIVVICHKFSYYLKQEKEEEQKRLKKQEKKEEKKRVQEALAAQLREVAIQ